MMQKVQNGHYVQVHYTGLLDDGTVFDSSEGRPPLEFQAGVGQVIPGFDNAVLGMELNQEKKFKLEVDEAYGPRRDDLNREFPVAMLCGQTVKVGQVLWFNSPQGPINGKVLLVDEEKFVVDFNHPLAGQNLQFHIKVVGISDRPTQTSGCACGSAPDGGSGCSAC